MKPKLLIWIILLWYCHIIYAQPPSIPTTDRIRLAEAFTLAEQIGNRLWPNWSKAPFAVLLVTPDYEFLVRHPKPSANFVRLGYDTLLKSDVYYRKRTFPLTFLATFPLDNTMISTVVVGQAENTWVKSSTPWVVTLLHEHFHQLQDAQSNAFAEVNALNLSHGDQTGMWMLNYAFPYDRKEVQDQFALMSRLLADAINSPKDERAKKVREYLAARRNFQSLLSPDDYKYFSFQFWKEGIARYTEYQIARMATGKYQPSRDFVALKDYRSFADVAKATYDGIFKQLVNQKLAESKREVVYSFGAAEGLLLDVTNPGWKKRYFVDKFDLGKFYAFYTKLELYPSAHCCRFVRLLNLCEFEETFESDDLDPPYTKQSIANEQLLRLGEETNEHTSLDHIRFADGRSDFTRRIDLERLRNRQRFIVSAISEHFFELTGSIEASQR